MEALGVASGLAGLIALAEIIATKGHKYCTRAKGARAEISDFVLEMQRLYGVLNHLRLLAICLEAENPSEAGNVTASRLDHFQACWKNLYYLKTALVKMDVDSKKDQLTWPFKTTETKELVLKIGRSRDDLSAALTADGLSALVTALSSTAKSLDTIENGVSSLQITLRETADQVIRKEKDEMKIKVYDWCSKVNPYDKHEISKSLRFPNTVLWIFDCDEYKVWVEEDNSAIWLYGIPGAGKTILTCALIEEVKSVVARTPGLALAYFYCENKSKDTHVLSNMIGSLVKQLSAVSTEAYDELLAYYTTCHGDHHGTNSPKAPDLCALLRRISGYFGTVFVIIDGIDECADPHERASILEFISTINTNQSGKIKVACTSRDEIDIRKSLAKFVPISIEALGTDLELFVSATIETKTQNGSLRIRDPLLKGEIINAIVAKAHGMFQWAKCQIDQICLLTNDKQRRKALETLPRDLFETYQRILERVDAEPPSNKDLVERSLRWLTHSEKSLSTESLLTAIAIDIGAESVDEDDFADEEDILKLCSSLISRANTEADSNGGSTLQLSHFTVKEFLTDTRLAQIPRICRYYMEKTTSHSIITRVCLTHLNMECFSRWQIPQGYKCQNSSWNEALLRLYKTYPMLEYATEQWYNHLIIAGEVDARFDLLCRLFEPGRTTNFQTWLHLIYMGAGKIVPTHASTIHLAASLRLRGICQWLIEEGVDINIMNEHLGTPLLCSIREYDMAEDLGPWPEIVRLLLENGADGSIKILRSNGSVDSTMSLALELFDNHDVDGVCDTIEVLLEFGALSSFSGAKFWSTVWEDISIIRLVEQFGRILETPLSVKIDSTTKSKILLYISTHGDKNDQTAAFRVAGPGLLLHPDKIEEILFSAAYYGQDHVIASYLASGNLNPAVLAASISEAVRGDFPNTVEFLLQNCPLEVEEVDNYIKKAFVICARQGSVKCMKLFLAAGQDPNVSAVIRNKPDGDNGDRSAILKSVLTTAVESGAALMVEFLATLDQVDFMATHNGDNMLILAVNAPRHRYRIAKTILGKVMGLPVNTSTQGILFYKFFRSKFEYGEEINDIKLLHLLVDQGYSLNGANAEGNTLLHAFFQGRANLNHGNVELGVAKDLIEFFLEGYHSIDKPNQSGQLPLHLAIEKSFPASIISNLIPKDISAWNHDKLPYPTPLHLVANLNGVYYRMQQNGLLETRIDVLHTLLAVPGANTNAVNTDGNTPLLVLAMTTTPGLQTTFSRLFLGLLKAGANLNAADSNQRTIVHILAGKNDFDNLKEVLKHNPPIFNRDKNGDSPLHLAVHFGNNRCVELLLEHEDKLEGQGLLPLDYDKSLGQKTSWGALPIALAARIGRPDILRLLYQHGQVKALKEPHLDHHHMTPLFYAIQNNNITTVETLIELGVNLDTTGHNRVTCLHVAASLGFEKMINLLLGAGANPLAVDSDGLQPYMVAASFGHKEAQALLEESTREILIGRQTVLAVGMESISSPSIILGPSSGPDNQLLTPVPSPHQSASVMLRAIHSTNKALCLALLKSGFGVNTLIASRWGATGTNGTCLHHASCNPSVGAVEIVNLLLEWKADISMRESKGLQPLHLACSHGSPETVQTLLDHGADLKPKCYNFKQTPLHRAAQYGRVEAAKRLLAYATSSGKKTLCLEMLDQNRRTPLLLAMEFGHVEISRFLISEGADIHKHDLYNYTILHHPGILDDKELFSELLSKTTDVNLSTYQGFNALHFLARRVCLSPEQKSEVTELALLLLASNINISSNNGTRTSPLHSACHGGNDSLVVELLSRMEEHEIDTLSQIHGTPLFAAAFMGHVTIVKLLLKSGADPNIEREGETPLQAAGVQENEEVVKVLEEWMDTTKQEACS